MAETEGKKDNWFLAPSPLGGRRLPATLQRRVVFWPVLLSLVVAVWWLCSVGTVPPPPPFIPTPDGDDEPAAALTVDEEYALLQAHKPILRFHSEDDWRPVSVSAFLRDATVQHRANGKWVPSPSFNPPTEGTLPRGVDHRLDLMHCASRKGAECYQGQAPALAGSPQLVYGRVWRNTSGEHDVIGYVLQYWLFYYFDDWRNHPAVPTMWQLHEGDWEVISVALSRNQAPRYAAYSRHCSAGGRRRPWASVERESGSHPVAYVALGSHANFFQPGSYAAEKKCLPPEAYRLTKRYRLNDLTGTATLRAAPERANPLELQHLLPTARWLTFGGPWGEDGYFRYQARSGEWRNIGAGRAPTGPAQKGQMWRNPAAATLAYRLEQ